MTCKTLQVTFPPYERMIAAQESLRYTVHVHRETLQQSIRRVVVAVKDKGAHVMIELYSDGRMSLVHRGQVFGSGRDEIAVEIVKCPGQFRSSDKPFVVTANFDYINDLFPVLRTEEMALSFSDAKGQIAIHGVIEGKQDSGHVHVVMPIVSF